MNTLLIGYDLNQPGKNYDALIDAIKGISGTYWHHLDSTWLVETTLTPVEVRDLLSAYLDSSDELLVLTASAPAAWRGFKESGSKWLKDWL